MKIDDTLMKQIAALAVIDMGPEEMEAQRQDLERIATFTEKLAELDTDCLPGQTKQLSPPLSHGSGFGGSGGYTENRLREDIVMNEDHAKEFVAIAPDSKGLYFRTPRTVDE